MYDKWIWNPKFHCQYRVSQSPPNVVMGAGEEMFIYLETHTRTSTVHKGYLLIRGLPREMARVKALELVNDWQNPDWQYKLA